MAGKVKLMCPVCGGKSPKKFAFSRAETRHNGLYTLPVEYYRCPSCENEFDVMDLRRSTILPGVRPATVTVEAGP